MKRVIFSLYIDIPEKDLDYQPPFYKDDIPKTLRTKLKMREYYSWLKENHEKYAETIGVEYKIFEYGEKWLSFKRNFNEKYPFITEYNIVNFYKIHLLYELCEVYDEVLYLDFDVVPTTTESFFDVWNIKENGNIIKISDENEMKQIKKINDIRENSFRYKSESVIGRDFIANNRSPTAKYWNCRALCLEKGYGGKVEVFNTGIIGTSKKYLDQLSYWENFDSLLKEMTQLKEDKDSPWLDWMKGIFGWDNETIWSFKTKENNVKTTFLDEKWHYIITKWNYIPKDTALVHVINKDFEFVRNRIDAEK